MKQTAKKQWKKKYFNTNIKDSRFPDGHQYGAHVLKEFRALGTAKYTQKNL